MLCEMKYTEKQFKIAGFYRKEVDNKQVVYKEQARTKKQIFWCFITNNGLAKSPLYTRRFSAYSGGCYRVARFRNWWSN